jgi:hypothetical protein
LDFDVVFEDGGAGLRDLVPGGRARCGFSVAGKAEAVGTDDGAVLQDDVVADLAALADHGVRVGEEVAADVGVGIQHDVGQQRRVIAKDNVVADDDIGADVGVGADLGSGSDDRGGMDSGLVNGGFVKQFQRSGEGKVGIVDAESGRGDLLKRGLDQYGGGLGGASERDVLGIGDEGELARSSVFQAGC